MMDRRLLTERRIEELAFDGQNQRTGVLRSGASRRTGDRRAA